MLNTCTLVNAAKVVYCLADIVRKVSRHGQYSLKPLMQWAVHILPQKELEQRHLLGPAKRLVQSRKRLRGM